MKEIEKILSTYDLWKKEGSRCALASVVEVEESSYRRIGARMLVSEDGRWIGGISGGCLEGDALARAQKSIYTNLPSSIVYDTLEDDQYQIGVGLGCNGKILVRFDPIIDDTKHEIQALRSFAQQEKDALLIKGLSESNSSFCHLLLEENQNDPFPNKDHLSSWCEEVRKSKKSKVFVHQNEKILVEYLKTAPKLIIFGDNYDVGPLVSIANELGWKITLVGKLAKLNKTLVQKLTTFLPYEHTDQLELNDQSIVIIMTHDYNKDKTILQWINTRKYAYLGLLGPKKRYIKLKEELELTLEHDPSFHTPIGLEIGANEPEEIALSILSEIIAHINDKPGTPLKLKSGPIHHR